MRQRCRPFDLGLQSPREREPIRLDRPLQCVETRGSLRQQTRVRFFQRDRQIRMSPRTHPPAVGPFRRLEEFNESAHTLSDNSFTCAAPGELRPERKLRTILGYKSHRLVSVGMRKAAHPGHAPWRKAQLASWNHSRCPSSKRISGRRCHGPTRCTPSLRSTIV